MTDDWSALIEVIKSLKEEPDFLKSYIWPIVTGLTSALLGAGIAFWTIKHQEIIQIEKDKLDSGNLLILKALQGQAHLVAWKANYSQGLSDEPLHRLVSIPRMVSTYNPIEYKIESILFTIRKPSSDEVLSKWSNVVRIMSMIENYNELRAILDKRSFSYEKIVEIISETPPAPVISPALIQQLIPHGLLRETLDLTEKTVLMVDDLIIELASFLQVFPDVLTASIKTKKIKHYGNVLTTSSPPDEYNYLYERCREVNYQRLAEIFNEDEVSVRQRYSIGQMTSES